MLLLLAGLWFGAEVDQTKNPVAYRQSWPPMGFSEETVAEQFATHQTAFQDCVSPETPPGIGFVTLETDETGRIEDRELRLIPAQDQKTEDCLSAALWRFTFPTASTHLGLVMFQLKINGLPATLRLESLTTTRGESDKAGIRTVLHQSQDALRSCLD